ncbi:hypothetical protein PGT21_002702 [Puccinia graminis f. sp. tritici]|uniref:Uncharacterized protein n=1 Tax=Puccinia graminis f. sp. tritici TaxID=56615 RepID=A0A5B0NPC0_PUCGR|nr:hypothetical protein PGT21_002702 [Puccinia graminis f. sp. tritici]
MSPLSNCNSLVASIISPLTNASSYWCYQEKGSSSGNLGERGFRSPRNSRPTVFTLPKHPLPAQLSLSTSVHHHSAASDKIRRSTVTFPWKEAIPGSIDWTRLSANTSDMFHRSCIPLSPECKTGHRAPHCVRSEHSPSGTPSYGGTMEF